MKIKINLGDWSDDGHGETEVVILEVNKSVEDLQEAYLNSCEVTGVDFHELCSEYEENIIDKELLTKLYESGITWLVKYKDSDTEEDEEYWDTKSFTKLLMDFIKISLPDLIWEKTEDNIPDFNGFWGDLNVTLGYGLFDN